MTVARDHCAKFSPPVLAAVRSVLADVCPPAGLWPTRVLDPFAGVGGIHQLRAAGYETVGVELEPEWACASQWTIVGDSRGLPFPDGRFDAVVTSPAYGNRMADSYDGSRDLCTACRGAGKKFECRFGHVPEDPSEGPDCPACGAVMDLLACEADGCVDGLAPSQRYTYRISLGRALSDGNGGGLQWGPAYRALHTSVWAECVRVLRPGGWLLLNISDHYRKKVLQGVDLWHAAVLGRFGLDLVRQLPISTSRNGNGANRDLRDSCEWLLVFRKPGA